MFHARSFQTMSIIINSIIVIIIIIGKLHAVAMATRHASQFHI